MNLYSVLYFLAFVSQLILAVNAVTQQNYTDTIMSLSMALLFSALGMDQYKYPKKSKRRK